MIEFKKLLYFVLLLIFFSCSTARNRNLAEHENPSIKESIINKTRTANLYKDYNRVVIMDAIYFDWELRKKIMLIFLYFFCFCLLSKKLC